MSERKREILVVSLVAVALIFLVSVVLLADGPGPAKMAKPQTLCPVSGQKINKETYVDVKGFRIFACCPKCIPTIKADPDKYIEKIRTNGEEPTVLPTPKAELPATIGMAAQCPVCTPATTGSAGDVKPMASAKTEAPANIGTQALAVLLHAGIPVTLLDARTGKSDDGKRIPGAVALAPKASAEDVATVVKSKDTLVVTYCVDVKCQASKTLAMHLKDLGYTNVLRYEKGIVAWQQAGQTVEQAKK